MKTIRIAALGVLMAGILIVQGPSARITLGQQPAPDRPAMGILPQPAGMSAGAAYKPFGVAEHIQNVSAQLAHQYAMATKDEDKKDIRKKLADSLNKEFDQLAQRQQAELDELERQVDKLKAVLKKRKDSKNAIVERRLEQLIQDAEGLGWGSPNHPNPYNDPFKPRTTPPMPLTR